MAKTTGNTRRSQRSADRRRALWPLALAGAIVWCSGNALPSWTQPVFSSDKVAHFLTFGLLATLVGRLEAMRRARPVGIYAAVLVVSAFGATDEFHQSLTPGRAMEFADWMADTLGAAVATALYARWPGYRRWLETPVRELGAKRRVEIGATACVIPADGTGGSPKADRGTALAGRET